MRMFTNYCLDMLTLRRLGPFWRNKPMNAVRYKTIELNGGW